MLQSGIQNRLGILADHDSNVVPNSSYKLSCPIVTCTQSHKHLIAYIPLPPFQMS
jgi:hypothetical protein